MGERTRKIMNGNLGTLVKIALAMIVIAGGLIGSYYATKALAQSAHGRIDGNEDKIDAVKDKVDAKEEKQIEVNKRFDGQLEDIKLEQREQRTIIHRMDDKLDRLIERGR